jgi:hypothetical protein
MRAAPEANFERLFGACRSYLIKSMTNRVNGQTVGIMVPSLEDVFPRHSAINGLRPFLHAVSAVRWDRLPTAVTIPTAPYQDQADGYAA